MCDRYYIDDGVDSDELRKIIDEVNRRSNADQAKTSGEIFPTDTVPIMANSRAMAPSAFAMSWGFSLPDGKRIINARSETAEKRRCSGMAWPSAVARYRPPTISSGSAQESRKRNTLFVRLAAV